jgi:hypothetical protein
MDKDKKRIIAEEKQFKQAKKDLERIVTIFDQVGFSEFVMYLKSPRRIIFWNFIAGVFKGLGVVVGMTIVVALLVWILTKMVDFPLIGEYFQNILDLVEKSVPGGVIK